MTSSTKPEVHNVHFVKCGPLALELRESTDRQRERQTDRKTDTDVLIAKLCTANNKRRMN